MSYKSSIFYGFWLFLTILFAYSFSYPLDIFSRHYFFGGSDLSVGLWVFNWQLSQLSIGNFDLLFTGNSFEINRPIKAPFKFSSKIKPYISHNTFLNQSNFIYFIFLRYGRSQPVAIIFFIFSEETLEFF